MSSRNTAGADIRRTLYHVLKERLSNIAKHARATQVEIEVVQDDRPLRLQVADDGIGCRRRSPRALRG